MARNFLMFKNYFSILYFIQCLSSIFEPGTKIILNIVKIK